MPSSAGSAARSLPAEWSTAAALADRAFAAGADRVWLEHLIWPLVGSRIAECRQQADRLACRSRGPWSWRCHCCSNPAPTTASTRQSRSWPTRHCAANAPRIAATGLCGNGASVSSASRKRPQSRRTSSSTTATSGARAETVIGARTVGGVRTVAARPRTRSASRRAGAAGLPRRGGLRAAHLRRRRLTVVLVLLLCGLSGRPDLSTVREGDPTS